MAPGASPQARWREVRKSHPVFDFFHVLWNLLVSETSLENYCVLDHLCLGYGSADAAFEQLGAC